MTLDLHIYPAERIALATFMKRHLPHIYVTDARKLTVEVLVLQDYAQQRATWNLDSWYRKPHNKRFRFRIKLVVAKVLHQLMQKVPLSVAEQSFLNQLDTALINLISKPLNIYQLILSQLPVSAGLQQDDNQSDWG